MIDDLTGTILDGTIFDSPPTVGYLADSSTTGSIINVPDIDLPATVNVIPRAVLDDQIVLSMDDVVRNAGGEIQRILQLGGRVHLHMLTGQQACDLAFGTLPGPASYVTHVPELQRLLSDLAAASFGEIEVTKHGEAPCSSHGGNEMRETMIVARKPNS